MCTIFHAVPTLILNSFAIAGKLHPFERSSITCAWSSIFAGSTGRGWAWYVALLKANSILKYLGYVRRPVRNNYIVLYLKVQLMCLVSLEVNVYSITLVSLWPRFSKCFEVIKLFIFIPYHWGNSSNYASAWGRSLHRIWYQWILQVKRVDKLNNQVYTLLVPLISFKKSVKWILDKLFIR